MKTKTRFIFLTLTYKIKAINGKSLVGSDVPDFLKTFYGK